MDVIDPRAKDIAEKVRVLEAAAELSRLLLTDSGAFFEHIQTAEIPVLGALVCFLHNGHTTPGIDPTERAFFVRQVVTLLDARVRQMESTRGVDQADEQPLAVVVPTDHNPDPTVLARRSLYRNPAPRPAIGAPPPPELSFVAEPTRAGLRAMVSPDLLVGRIDPVTEANGGMVTWSSLDGSGVTRTEHEAKLALRAAWVSAWTQMFRSPVFVAFFRGLRA